MNTRGKRSERGMSAVEYGLIIAGIAALLVVVLPAIGLGLQVWVDACAGEAIATGNQPAACG